MAASVACGPWAPACAAGTAAYITSTQGGSLGDIFKSAAITGMTALAFSYVGNVTGGHFENGYFVGGSNTPMTPAEYFGSGRHFANMLGHAAVGCGSAAASGDKCGPAAFAGAAGSAAGPKLVNAGFVGGLVASSVIGGTASVIGGGNFANGAKTAAYGYLFNQMAEMTRHSAFSQARQDAGVPRNAIPEVRYTPLYDYDNYGNRVNVFDKNGNLVMSREYLYNTAKGQIIIREHSIGHVMNGKFVESGHFNVVNQNGTNIQGTQNHYNFRAKLDPMRYFWQRPAGGFMPRGGSE